MVTSDEQRAQERWRRADRLLARLLDLEPEEREPELDRACVGDPALRGWVERLLDAANEPLPCLEDGAVALAAPSLDAAQTPGDEGWPMAEGRADGVDPGERFGAYRIVREIGAGGMSRVYLALGEGGREVAIKVLRHDAGRSASLQQRFHAERQILASFDHPAIATVYGGGVAPDGRPYLVMEWVDGQPLTLACDERGLDLEARLALFVEVCDAVHYAHQRLIVHRDLKPSNIFVTEDGRIKLLDFGIAKLLDPRLAGGSPLPQTRTGVLLLTPEYAAPEQLRGDTVTTASDVYALGVVLFELVTGRRPHHLEGLSPGQMERRVCDQDPPRPSAVLDGGRSADRGLVADLDTVVLEALSIEPGARYASARELGDEIRRLLSGESIVARPVGVVARGIRKARRHPRRTMAVAAALMLLLALGALHVHTRWTARREALVAQRLGQEAEQIEAQLQRAYMAPRHDIRPAVAAVRQRLARIELDLPSLRGTARAAGHYALGRGHLALGEDLDARRHFEQAREAGIATPQVAYGLGLALGRLYRSGLEEVGRIRSAEERTARRAELEAGLRTAALAALSTAEHADRRDGFIEASLQFFSGHAEQALATLEAWQGREPWFYEADLLAGDIHHELSRRAVDAGLADRARLAVDSADAAYRRAIEVARSDPRGYEGRCNLWADELHARIYGTQVELESVRDTGLESCRQATETNPDRPAAHLQLGRIGRLWADLLAERGKDPGPSLVAAREALLRAARLDPDNAEPWVVIGTCHRSEATFLASRGRDPLPAYAASLEAFERASEINPASFAAQLSRSLAELHLGDFERRRGGLVAEKHFENAVHAAGLAAELAPAKASSHVNLGIAYGQLAILRRDHGAEAHSLFDAGEAALRRAAELNPEMAVAPYNLGEMLLERAELVLSTGGDPTGLVERSAPLLARAEAAWPEWAVVFFMQARGQALLARWALASGGDPGPALDLAEERLAAGFALTADDPMGLLEAARLALVRARWRLQDSESPVADLARAERRLDQALDVNPRFAGAYRERAETHRYRGAWLLRRGGDPRDEIDAGLAAVSAALAINARDAATHLVAALLELLRVDSPSASTEETAQALDSARSSARRSLELRSGWSEASAALARIAELDRPGGADRPAS